MTFTVRRYMYKHMSLDFFIKQSILSLNFEPLDTLDSLRYPSIQITTILRYEYIIYFPSLQ